MYLIYIFLAVFLVNHGRFTPKGKILAFLLVLKGGALRALRHAQCREGVGKKLLIFAEKAVFRVLRPHFKHRQVVVLDVFLDGLKILVGKCSSFLNFCVAI